MPLSVMTAFLPGRKSTTSERSTSGQQRRDTLLPTSARSVSVAALNNVRFAPKSGYR
jgi:hypothetical protein